MNKGFISGLILMCLFACDKEEPKPELEYLNIILAGQATGLGILYSDMPDDTLLFDYPSSSAKRLIDINDDGVNDFELLFSGTASPGHQNSKNSILPIGNSALAAPDIENSIVDTILLNDTIGENLNWINDTCIIYNYSWDVSGASSETGLWNNVKNKYIGTKILIDDKVLYGWLRIEVTNGWNLTLLDYACTIGYEIK